MGADASMQKKIFEEFDSDGSGMIDSMEIASYMAEHYTTFPLEAVQLLISLADKDGNGEIDKKEFADFYKIVLAIVSSEDQGLKNVIYTATSVAENSPKISRKRMEQVLKSFGVKGQINQDSYDKTEFLQELSQFIPY
ncbi:Calmodulin [Hexamita inflata]|uniref:Calmodulin n=1 Tax=Hexamita inflata TaxID=28002 RepID=A0AA86QVJ5_9EUKA|nr:Calmodulin [Hexamita inflata]